MSEFISAQREANVLTITLDRPDKRNAVSNEMYAELSRLFLEASEDTSVKVVVLRANGDAFCAGNDIDDFTAQPPTSRDAPVWQFLRALMRCDKPVVAVVQGIATGIGTTLLLHCDIVYAAEDATFRLPFASIGLTPEGLSTLLLPLLAGRQRASELLLLGSPFKATEAHALGMVNAVVPKDALDSAVRDITQRLSVLPNGVLRRTKRLIADGMAVLTERHFLAECDALAEAVTASPAREAFAAFKEKRRPDFSKTE
jgi:enoyl-CoA hydratase/carnithine racemase